MKLLVFVTFIMLATASCSPGPASPANRLDSLFSSQIKKDNPGASVLIMKGDSVIFSKSYGVADLNTKEQITSKTIFNLGSISKTFVMNSILMLRDEGKLNLEDSLIKYFPEFKNKDIAQKVKIKHLLTHTSGLPDLRPVEEQFQFYLTADDAQNWQPITQTDSLQSEPGSKYSYFNPGYNALALIIEKVTGNNWRDFVKERIFKPAGMETSTITDGPHPDHGVSHAYYFKEDKWNEWDFGEEPTFCAAGNGGVWSSIEEVLKYYKALEAAKFSNANTIAESMEEKSFGIGWSWFVDKTPGGLKTVGHTGSQGGFRCDYLTVPEKKIVYIMLSNFPIERKVLHAKFFEYLEL